MRRILSFRKIACFVLWAFLLATTFGCNKLVQVPLPDNTVTAGQAFSTDATATAAMLGVYYYMTESQSFSSVESTYYLGESADELRDKSPGGEAADYFLSNTLKPLNSSTALMNNFWRPAYYDIYCVNAILSGLANSSGMSSSVKQELDGEAKFIRAFCYFYLTNIFGDVPLVLTTDFNKSALLAKSHQNEIYQQVITDLTDAETLLPSDFSLSGGLPIRANKWAAAALLARVYLYQGNWQGADSASSAVIGCGQFSLVDSLNSVFLAGSNEAILQLEAPDQYPYATWEGNFFIPPPPSTTRAAKCWLTSQLLGAFENGDLRRLYWVDSTTYRGTVYYYPFKYQIFSGSQGNVTEYYTLLRFAEQYLIRAEAEANLNQLGGAINDIDAIRSRAMLPNLPDSLNQAQVLAAIQHEDRIEFFAEWGHRWLDLKRWGMAISILDTISYKNGNIGATQLLYPIPLIEIQDDPNLTENPGYSY
jgi:hypothetical protein